MQRWLNPFKDWLSWAVFVHRTDMPQKKQAVLIPYLVLWTIRGAQYQWCWRVRH